jgi:hypothetical protein
MGEFAAIAECPHIEVTRSPKIGHSGLKAFTVLVHDGVLCK